MENSKSIMPKHKSTSWYVNPATLWKRWNRKNTPKNTLKEVRNCPTAVRKKEALYCIMLRMWMERYLP